jgi:ATP-dependent Clp protease ATP-binding subunit ClpA
MPKINVYLPDELAEAVKDARVPVSSICQRALKQAVRFVVTIHQTVRDGLDPADLAAQLPQFTVRAREAIAQAIDTARAASAPAVDTGDLLAGIIDGDDGVALDILRAIEIDPALVRRGLAAGTGDEPGEPATAGAASFTTPAATVIEAALAESMSLGHNYVGCELLLIAMIEDPDGKAGRVLRALGADARSTRRAVTAALTKVASTPLVTQRQMALLISRVEHLEQKLDLLKDAR